MKIKELYDKCRRCIVCTTEGVTLSGAKGRTLYFDSTPEKSERVPKVQGVITNLSGKRTEIKQILKLIHILCIGFLCVFSELNLGLALFY